MQVKGCSNMVCLFALSHTTASSQVLDVSSDKIFTALRHAQQVGMMTEPYSYLVTSLDLQSADLEDFKFSRTKISGLRLIDTESSGNYMPSLKWHLFIMPVRVEVCTLDGGASARGERRHRITCSLLCDMSLSLSLCVCMYVYM